MKERDCENCVHHTDNGCSSWDCEYKPNDLISRADAIAYIDRVIKSGLGRYKSLDYIRKYISALPPADAEQGDYAKWLENIIVKAETIEWLCEDTPCKEWCDENCHYSSIQAECLRHLYEVSKGGGDE